MLNRAVILGFTIQIVWKFGLSFLVKVSWKILVLKVWLVTFGESFVENICFGSLNCYFWWKSRGKCPFWKLGLSLLIKVSWKMFVFEAFIVIFGKRFMENTRFGSLDCHFW